MKIGTWLSALLLAVLFAAAAGAEEVDPAAMDAMQEAHPAYAVMAQAQRGDIAAAAFSLDEASVLCVAEKRDGMWTVTVDNPAALRPWGEAPELTVGADESLSWRYVYEQSSVEYRAIREADGWGSVSCHSRQEDGYGLFEYDVTLEAYGQRPIWVKRNAYRNASGDLLRRTTDMPVPADWLTAYAPLATFSERQWMVQAHAEEVAQCLMPGEAFCGGTIQHDSMQFLMRRADGSLVLTGVTFSEASGWTLTESSPLPEGTVYGYDCYTSSLRLPDGLLCSVKRGADGRWGLAFVTQDGRDFVYFGQGWIARDACARESCRYGDHPWNDITAMDWERLPHTMEEALAGLDDSAWAVVGETGAEDTLALLSEPKEDATVLCRYFRAVPVRVLSREDEWARVEVFGAQGYMPLSGLTFGEAAGEVEDGLPYLVLREETVPAYVRPDERTASFTVCRAEHDMDMRVLGLSDDGWYHIWFVWSGRDGYVRKNALEPGSV